ncbi:MAG: DUF4316 domain-containing protein [Clostridiales bacterium]|nr:DUF4316 domain-containing protein [Clostridiales bacterium]
MIDGIINNGPRKEERSEKKGSLLEKLQEKKTEALQQGQIAPKPVKDKITDKGLS